MRPQAHQELTDEENEKILGTLTHETWVGLSVEIVASEWYRLDTDLSYLDEIDVSPATRLIHEARLSSGSIGGEHRKDLKEAIIGAPASATNLSVPIVNANGQPTAQNHQPMVQPKRGF